MTGTARPASSYQTMAGYLVKRAQTALHVVLERALDAHQVTVPQYAILGMLSDSPGISNAELARRSFVTPQSMNEVLKQLEEAGLIVRRPNPSNARVLDARLTRAGELKIAATDPDVNALEDRMLAGLTPAEKQELTRALSVVVANLTALSVRADT